MKTYILASFLALAPIHAYAGQSQVPSAPFEVATGDGGGGFFCANGILNVLNCNDIDVGVDILAKVPNASFQVATGGDFFCANGIGNISNCNDVDIGVDVG